MELLRRTAGGGALGGGGAVGGGGGLLLLGAARVRVRERAEHLLELERGAVLPLDAELAPEDVGRRDGARLLRAASRRANFGGVEQEEDLDEALVGQVEEEEALRLGLVDVHLSECCCGCGRSVRHPALA